MKIARIDVYREHVPLTKSYTVAYGTKDSSEIFYVRIETACGQVGIGSGTPSFNVTGVTADETAEGLTQDRLKRWIGADPRHLGTRISEVRKVLGSWPAACAAMDIALHDLVGRALGVPVVDLLGRKMNGLLTSVTIGIEPVEETLELARGYLAAGFGCLKVKIGHDLEVDLERLRKLRSEVSSELPIRVDANQGYSLAETKRFFEESASLNIEFVEQPMRPDTLDEMRTLPSAMREQLAADESIQTTQDAWELASPTPFCGIYNIKLMKSGGIAAGLEIARIAEHAGVSLMWGCMDESNVSIAAGLHAAYASPNTRYLDLDGSFDLAKDPVRGGFELRDGRLYLVEAPGLGVVTDWH